jgi:hypothetical protein
MSGGTSLFIHGDNLLSTEKIYSYPRATYIREWISVIKMPLDIYQLLALIKRDSYVLGMNSV